MAAIKTNRWLAAMTGAVLAAFTTGQALAQEIVVGGKNFTEQLLLAEMTKQLLETKGFEVSKKDGLGSTVLRQAQQNGQVDLYWEYTGTSLVTYNKVEEKLDADATLAKVRELDGAQGLTWLDPSKANNTYAFAVKNGDEKTADINTLSDLAKRFNDGKPIDLAVNAEFPRPSRRPSWRRKHLRLQGRAREPEVHGVRADLPSAQRKARLVRHSFSPPMAQHQGIRLQGA